MRETVIPYHDMLPRQIRDAAYKLISEHGPMKAKVIAAHLGAPNGRSISMALQWDGASRSPLGLTFDGGKWAIKPRAPLIPHEHSGSHPDDLVTRRSGSSENTKTAAHDTRSDTECANG